MINRFLPYNTNISAIVRKSSTFAPARDHVNAFKSLLGENSVLTSDDAVEKYSTDWTRSFRGGGGVVCLPRSTEEVSKLLRYCQSKNVAVVPQGGNTGLVGGAVGKAQEVICSMERMNKIIDINQDSGVMTCEAGAVLETLGNTVAEKGFIIPLDLGAKGSCQIGGNVATNAGGMRVLRYGSMHANVLGLEVVLPNGEVLDLMSNMKKNNTGLHLKNLFIGSEGTLGIITKIALQLAPLPVSSPVLIARLPSFSQVPSVLRLARQQLSDVLSAFEFIDMPSLKSVHQAFPDTISSMQSPVVALPSPPPSSSSPSSSSSSFAGIEGEVLVILECVSFQSTNAQSASDRLIDFASPLLDQGIITDALLSQDVTQQRDMWKLREQVPVALATLSRPHGKLFKYDVSLPLSSMSEFVSAIQSRVSTHLGNKNANKKENEDAMLEFCNFGHAGDQNLHLNILCREITCPSPSSSSTSSSSSSLSHSNLTNKERDAEINRLQTLLDDIVYSEVIARRGSVSAEHGIGQLKKKLMSQVHGQSTLDVMTSLKRTIDPSGIMNPGKIFNH